MIGRYTSDKVVVNYKRMVKDDGQFVADWNKAEDEARGVSKVDETQFSFVNGVNSLLFWYGSAMFCLDLTHQAKQAGLEERELYYKMLRHYHEIKNEHFKCSKVVNDIIELYDLYDDDEDWAFCEVSEIVNNNYATIERKAEAFVRWLGVHFGAEDDEEKNDHVYNEVFGLLRQWSVI